MEAPDASACWRRVRAVARERGWSCPKLIEFRRRIDRDVPRAEQVRAREGALAAMNLHPHQTRTVADLHPLAILCGDGRQHDVIVLFPSGREGRPCVWAWQDVYTRRILAWAAGETESADLVRTSLHEVLTKHGVPDAVLMDSTRAASAKYLTGGQPGRRRWRSTDEELPGLLKLLDIRYSITAVDRDGAGKGKGRGRSKPIERALGDLARHIDTHPFLAGSYTGRSTSERPENHRSKAACWEDFLAVVEQAVEEHNARPGRQTEIAAGRSFNAAWSESVSRAAIRRMTASQASILLLAAEDQKVRPNGTIALRTGRGTGLPSNRYHHPDLVEWSGRRVIARFDPARLHEPLQIYDLEGRYLCAADCVLPEGFSDAAAAGPWEKARKRIRRAAEMGLAARRDEDAVRQAGKGARSVNFRNRSRQGPRRGNKRGAEQPEKPKRKAEWERKPPSAAPFFGTYFSPLISIGSCSSTS